MKLSEEMRDDLFGTAQAYSKKVAQLEEENEWQIGIINSRADFYNGHKFTQPNDDGPEYGCEICGISRTQNHDGITCADYLKPIIAKAGLIFLRACVGQGRVPDTGDLKLMLRDFSQLQSDNVALRRETQRLMDDNYTLDNNTSALKRAIEDALHECWDTPVAERILRAALLAEQA